MRKELKSSCFSGKFKIKMSYAVEGNYYYPNKNEDWLGLFFQRNDPNTVGW